MENVLLLDKTSDHAQRVVQTSLGFVENQAVGAAADDRHRLYGSLDAGDFDGA